MIKNAKQHRPLTAIKKAAAKKQYQNGSTKMVVPKRQYQKVVSGPRQKGSNPPMETMEFLVH
jgi:hypothetical protein